jgi:hypothetical protein
MAKGDQANIAERLRTVLPPSWFRSSGDLPSNPVLAAVLAMPAQALSWIYGLVSFTRLQTRLATATGGFLDLLAWDYLAGRVRRRTAQSDAAFRARIRAEILRPRVTRQAMRNLLLELTGREPVLFEPMRPSDTGAYNGPRIGYGVAGRYGSMSLPKQVFIDVRRDITAGIPRVSGYGQPAGGYGVGRVQWTDLDVARSDISDEELLNAIVANKAEGVTAWVRIGF